MSHSKHVHTHTIPLANIATCLPRYKCTHTHTHTHKAHSMFSTHTVCILHTYTKQAKYRCTHGGGGIVAIERSSVQACAFGELY